MEWGEGEGAEDKVRVRKRKKRDGKREGWGKVRRKEGHRRRKHGWEED